MTDSASAYAWRLCLCLSHQCESGLSDLHFISASSYLSVQFQFTCSYSCKKTVLDAVTLKLKLFSYMYVCMYVCNRYSKPTGILRGHTAPIFHLFIVHEDDRIFSFSTDKTVKVSSWRAFALLPVVKHNKHNGLFRKTKSKP